MSTGNQKAKIPKALQCGAKEIWLYQCPGNKRTQDKTLGCTGWLPDPGLPGWCSDPPGRLEPPATGVAVRSRAGRGAAFRPEPALAQSRGFSFWRELPPFRSCKANWRDVWGQQRPPARGPGPGP